MLFFVLNIAFCFCFAFHLFHAEEKLYYFFIALRELKKEKSKRNEEFISCSHSCFLPETLNVADVESAVLHRQVFWLVLLLTPSRSSWNSG
jgi:hypothetical protein